MGSESTLLRILRPLGLIAFSVFMFGCGVSPILNHVKAKTPKGQISEIERGVLCAHFFSHENLCARAEWIQGPHVGSENQMRIRFWNPKSGTHEGPFADPINDVIVQLWMPSMNHGSSPVKVLRESAGVYFATQIFFTMTGDWEVRFQLKQGRTLLEQSVESYVF